MKLEIFADLSLCIDVWICSGFSNTGNSKSVPFCRSPRADTRQRSTLTPDLATCTQGVVDIDIGRMISARFVSKHALLGLGQGLLLARTPHGGGNYPRLDVAKLKGVRR